MMKKLAVLLAVLFLFSLVFAEGWGDINTGENDSGQESGEGSSSYEETEEAKIPMTSGDGKAKTKYTTNFYLALGLGTLAVLVVLYMIYLFIRGPIVKWKKPRKKKK